MPGDKKRKVSRLRNLEVYEVSYVDRPANLRPFLIIKSAEDPMKKGREIKPEAEATPVVVEDEKVEAKKDESSEEGSSDGTDTEESFSDDEKPAVQDDGVEVEVTDNDADDLVATAKAFMALIEELRPADVEKAGRKISARRLTRLREMHGSLGELLSDLEPPAADPESSETVDTEKEKECGPDGKKKKPYTMAKSEEFLALTKQVASMASVIKSLNSEVSRLKNETPASQSRSAGESVSKSDSVTWPADFNQSPLPEDESFD